MTETSVVAPAPSGPAARRRALRRVAGYGGALAMTPYLLIKVSWVVGGLLGVLSFGPELGRTGWVVLNAVTIAMSAAGIAVALALAGNERRRAQEAALLILSWIGVGFLVPMLPYLVASTLLGGAGPSGGQGGDDAAAAMPGWEAVLIQVSFAGLALGLAVALPLFLLERRSAFLTGRLADTEASSAAAPNRRLALSTLTVLAASVLSLLGLYWAAGGRAGLDHPGARDLNWHLLHANTACWALLGAVAAWMLGRARPASLPRWIPVAIAWAVSGFLVAWNCWKLPLIGYLAIAGTPAGQTWPENPGAAAAQCLLGVLAGSALLATLLHARPSPR